MPGFFGPGVGFVRGQCQQPGFALTFASATEPRFSTFMHKTLLSLALALAAPLLASAQNTPETTPPAAPAMAPMPANDPDTSQDLTLGLKVFGGVATILGNDADVLFRSVGNGVAPLSSVATEQQVLPTGGGGLTAHLKVGTAGWGVETELLYVLKGGQLRADNYRTNLYLHYVSLPVLIRYQREGLYAEAGPQISYLVDAQVEQTPQLTGPGFTSDAVTNRSAYNEAEWGYALGLGYNFPSNLTLGLRYNGAIRPLLPKQAGTEIKAYNAGVELHLGILFGKRKTMAAR